MANISAAIEAKSDQLNAVDIVGGDRVIKITNITVRSGDQPVSIYFEGDHGKPWKPSKGMLRIMAKAWGDESDIWVGRSAKIFFEPSVVYAGKEVGGIQIRALSDIPKNGIKTILVKSKQKREPYIVEWLDTARPLYPEDKFSAGLPAMVKAIKDGKMTLQQVMMQCQKTGDLTQDQIERLQADLPIEIEDEGQE